MPYSPNAIGWALSGSSLCSHPLTMPRFADANATSFCSAITNISFFASSAELSSVGPFQSPTKVLIPIALYFRARTGDCSHTPMGKKPRVAWKAVGIGLLSGN